MFSKFLPMKSSWTEWRIPGLWLSVDDGPKQRPDQLDTNPQTEDAPSLPTEAHLSACDSLVVYREPPGASRMIYVQSKMLSTFQTSKWFCHSQQRKKEPSQSTSFPLWWAFRDGSYQENKLKRTLGHSNNETIPKLLSATQIIPFWIHISWAWPFYSFNCNCACLTSNNVAGVDLLQVSVRRA